jgi:dihydrofolate reductase
LEVCAAQSIRHWQNLDSREAKSITAEFGAVRSVFLGGDIAQKIAKIKQQGGPDLHVYGSANLVQTLLKHDLVDALWLKIFPITLGAGKKLFADGTIPAAFKVTESTVTSKGVIIINYERAGAVPTGSM